jgi:hypothetical protein
VSRMRNLPCRMKEPALGSAAQSPVPAGAVADYHHQSVAFIGEHYSSNDCAMQDEVSIKDRVRAAAVED